MTFEANVTVIIILATVLSGALMLLAYGLGKREGYDKAMDDMERRQIRHSLASYPNNKSRRRLW